MIEELMTEITENIKSKLEAEGKNQTWLANEAGFQLGHISELMNGKKFWRIEHLYKISKALNVSLWTLFISDSRPISSDEEIIIDAYNALNNEDLVVVDRFLFGRGNAPPFTNAPPYTNNETNITLHDQDDEGYEQGAPKGI